jgi:hypothetical protein
VTSKRLWSGVSRLEFSPMPPPSGEISLETKPWKQFEVSPGARSEKCKENRKRHAGTKYRVHARLRRGFLFLGASWRVFENPRHFGDDQQ